MPADTKSRAAIRLDSLDLSLVAMPIDIAATITTENTAYTA